MEDKNSFLRDDSPYSTMRLAIIFVIALFIPFFVYVWTVVSLKTAAMAVIPDSVNWLLGTTLGAKAAQKVVETVPSIIEAIKGNNGTLPPAEPPIQ